MVAFVEDVVARDRGRCTADVATRRAAAADDAFAEHAAAADGRRAARRRASTRRRRCSARTFRLVPSSPLAGRGGDGLGRQAARRRPASCSTTSTTTPRSTFPSTTGCYGVARVREPLRHLEQAGLLAGALGRAEPELTPVQLPHRSGDAWLALEFPAGPGPHRRRALALHRRLLRRRSIQAATLCGLLLDEWTEVVPGDVDHDRDRVPLRPALQRGAAVAAARHPGDARTGPGSGTTCAGACLRRCELARQRAVEPVHLDATAYARFLPATITATTLRGISIATVVRRQQRIVRHLEVLDG